MKQGQVVDYLWEKGFFEERRQSKKVVDEVWSLFKIDCSNNISTILKGKRYLSNKKGWRQTYGPDTKKSNDSSCDKIKSVYIEAGKPITAMKKVGEILKGLRGKVLICDNYFGVRSMINLYKLKGSKKVSFICGNVNGDEKEMRKLVKDYNKEGCSLEVKVFDRAQLHDRYILTDKELIILGHGFADLGNKESLNIVIPNNLVKDISDDLRNRFIQKWKSAKVLG